MNVTAAGDAIFDTWFSQHEEEDGESASAAEGRVTTASDIIDDCGRIAFVNCLLSLAILRPPTTCPR